MAHDISHLKSPFLPWKCQIGSEMVGESAHVRRMDGVIAQNRGDQALGLPHESWSMNEEPKF